MSQCLRCSKSCSASAVFCDECRSLLRNQLQQAPSTRLHAETPPQATLLSARNAADEHNNPDQLGEVQGDPLQRITSPLPIVKPSRPPLLAAYTNIVDQALSRLSEAARRIAEAEGDAADGPVNRRPPHPPRLAPIRDISADIQRESTPLRQVHNFPTGTQGENLAERMPDLWPWLPETDPEENDTWAGHTDPLQSRHFPRSAEAAQIEAEDIRRALAEGIKTSPFLTASTQKRKHTSHVRLIFGVLAVMAILALVIDGALLSVAFNHTHRPIHQNDANGPSSLTLTPNVASIGQTISVRIDHFTPSSSVLLTHDIEEEVKTTSGSSVINIGASGSATATVSIDDSWGPGFHQVYAEDVKTRYTATAQLQIINQGPTRPSHFVVGVPFINMGPDLQGTNTIQTLTLSNSGGGSISWAASSNVPWLLLSPTQGVFSQSQTITVAVERSNLKPGDYKGMITISSNVSSPQRIPVEMTVRPLPANAGSVLAITPAVLSFVATDGVPDPYIQVLTISNPGSKPLSWSLVSNTPATAGSQFSLFSTLGAQANWLVASRTAGIVSPGSTGQVYINVNSQNLLPGTYMGTILFSATGGALDSPQTVSVSLTIQPRCGLITSTGNLSFTAVAGARNPGNQSLNLSATASCGGVVNWQANVSARWLTVTPGGNLPLKGTAPTTISIGVNTSGLSPAKYAGAVTFTTLGSTQTVAVNLSLQAPPPPGAPLMSASPILLNFSNVQGQPNPSNQIVTISNSGGSTLYWNTTVTPLGRPWLYSYPSVGNVVAGQSGQFTINVDTTNLTPGTYVGQITLYGNSANGLNAGSSPETLMVNLVVQPPCSLAQPSSSTLAFSATLGSSDPSPQTISMTGSGSCGWPLLVKASILPSPPSWLQISPPSGSIKGTGQSVSMSVAPTIANLGPGTYTAQISLAATDSSGTRAQGSPQLVSVTLSVLQPCTLHVAPLTLNFSVPQGQASSAQTFTLNENGSCARPVSWTAAADPGSTSWLNLSSTSGIDAGRGSTLGVTVNPPSTLSPGTYSGQITVTASGSGGVVAQRSPQTITVNLTVTGFSVSGTVMACLITDPTCIAPVPLPNATVSLVSGTTTISTITADTSGNFTISSIPLGSYTLSASGVDSSNIHYIGTIPLNVTGNQTNITLKVNPGS